MTLHGLLDRDDRDDGSFMITEAWRGRIQMKSKGCMSVVIVCALMTVALQVTSAAQDDLDYQTLSRIRDEGLGSS